MKRWALLCALFISLASANFASAVTKPSPQLGSFEVKTGFWLPQSPTVKQLFGLCCNLITKVQGGVLFQRRFGLEGGVGVFYKPGQALGTATGDTSQDRFWLLLIPMETNAVLRIEHETWRYVAPIFKVGADYVYFRESTAGNIIQGIKYGVHGVGGMQILLTHISDGLEAMDADFGINDLFLTLEAQYQWINNFGKQGLNLSGQLYSIGLLFEF